MGQQHHEQTGLVFAGKVSESLAAPCSEGKCELPTVECLYRRPCRSRRQIQYRQRASQFVEPVIVMCRRRG